jgi:hypothetical protein
LEPAPIPFRLIDFVSPSFGAATDGNRLFVSRDGGETWEHIALAFPITHLDFVNEQEGWAAGHGELWHTADGGKTWRVQLQMPGKERWLGRTLVRFSSEVTGWALFCYGQGAGSQEPYLLYRTEDGGQNWTPKLMGRWLFGEPAPTAPPGPGGYPVALAVKGENAWLAVHSPAGGYLEIVRVAGDDSPPVPGTRIPLTGSRRPTVELSFADPNTGWLVVDGALTAIHP